MPGGPRRRIGKVRGEDRLRLARGGGAMLRIGLIGCGGNMRAHVRRLLEVPEAEIVAIAEPNGDNVATARQQYPALVETPVYAGHEQLLAGARPDAVVISTPHTLH